MPDPIEQTAIHAVVLTFQNGLVNSFIRTFLHHERASGPSQPKVQRANDFTLESSSGLEINAMISPRHTIASGNPILPRTPTDVSQT